MNFGMQFLLVFVLIMCATWIVERLLHRHSCWKRTNRYRSGFLPPPDSKCVVGESWKTTVPQSLRY